MFDFVKKLFNKKCPLEQAISLLEECAKKGDIRAQQILHLYRSAESSNFSPLQDSFSAIDYADIIKCIKKPRTSTKKARNPYSNHLVQGKKYVKNHSQKTLKKAKVQVQEKSSPKSKAKIK